MDAFNEAQIKDDENYKGLGKAKYILSAHPHILITETKTEAKWEIDCDGYYPYCTHCNSEPKSKKITPYCAECGAKMINYEEFFIL